MAKHMKVLKAADGGKEITVEALNHSIVKDLTRYADSDGSNTYADDNRYVQTINVTGTVDRVAMEYLVSTATMTIGATYPQIVVYNKSAADYYNTYSGVAVSNIKFDMIDDDLWRVSATFSW